MSLHPIKTVFFKQRCEAMAAKRALVLHPCGIVTKACLGHFMMTQETVPTEEKRAKIHHL